MADIKCDECLGSMGMRACADSKIPTSSAQNPLVSTGFEKQNKLESFKMRTPYSVAVSIQCHVDHSGPFLETLETTETTIGCFSLVPSIAQLIFVQATRHSEWRANP